MVVAEPRDILCGPSPNRAYLASCLRHSAQIPRYLEVSETREIQMCQEAHQNARNFRYAQPLDDIDKKNNLVGLKND